MTSVPLDFTPSNEIEFKRALSDPMWRLCSGKLYKIVDKSGNLVPFIPNKYQSAFLKALWFKNIILKARQLGYSTLVAIMWLDHALFNAHQRCDIIAQDQDSAKTILRDKIVKAYDNLPKALREAMPLKRSAADEVLFGHNESFIRVSTSGRGGTINRLHVSEFGKIGAKYPDKAEEVVSGSLPAVTPDGIAIIESTAEGQSGAFFSMSQQAMATDQEIRSGARSGLTTLDYKFHFTPWWAADEYEIDPGPWRIERKDNEYFDRVEAEQGCVISLRKRAWYVAFRANNFAGDPALMWREMPSSENEAFQQSAEGTYYTRELTAARVSGRIGVVPVAQGSPVNTFWDIGASDGTAIWLHQKIGAEHRFIGFEEEWGEPYRFFINLLQSKGYVWGTHFLPHDAQHKRQQGLVVASPIEMLQQLAPGWRFQIVPRVDSTQNGIQLVRDIFGQCWFDEAACRKGLEHLSQYRRTWNARQETYTAEPLHDKHSEAADAFRQFAQGWAESNSSYSGTPSWRRSGVSAKVV